MAPKTTHLSLGTHRTASSLLPRLVPESLLAKKLTTPLPVLEDHLAVFFLPFLPPVRCTDCLPSTQSHWKR